LGDTGWNMRDINRSGLIRPTSSVTPPHGSPTGSRTLFPGVKTPDPNP